MKARAMQESPLMRKVIHIDMDAYFASVEQRDNLELRGKPVAVGGSLERGMVAAASHEARKFGVRSAMPSVTAHRRCLELILVKLRFDVYKQISSQFRAIFAEHTPVIEPLSLDEAYLDVTDNFQGILRDRDCRAGKSKNPFRHRPDRIGGRFLQQVPRQARIGPSQA
jgi:DNA polymerase IV